MQSSRMGLTAVAGGVIVVLMLGFVTLTGLSASLAWSQSGGYGSGPGICQAATATPATVSPTPGSTGATPSPTGTAPACVPASKIGAQVVALAKAIADALYVNPACGGHISYPNCYYSWYKAPGSSYPSGSPPFPQAVINYGQQVCPGCAAWANGNYQCVSFVRGAYSQVYPMRLTANAFDLWATYAGQPGWQEIPSLVGSTNGAAQSAHAGRRDDLQGQQHWPRCHCDECTAADGEHGRRDHLQQLQQREPVHHHAAPV